MLRSSCHLLHELAMLPQKVELAFEPHAFQAKPSVCERKYLAELANRSIMGDRDIIQHRSSTRWFL
jgi:hypothetical protein